MSAKHIVESINAVWTAPPEKNELRGYPFSGAESQRMAPVNNPEYALCNTYTASPVMGNGDMAAAVAGDYDNYKIFITKGEMWSDRQDYDIRTIRPITVGGINLFSKNGKTDSKDYGITQNLYKAEIDAKLCLGGGSLKLKSFISAREGNFLITRIENTSSNIADLGVKLWTKPDDPRYPACSGIESSCIWAARETYSGDDGVRFVVRVAMAAGLIGTKITGTDTDHDGMPVMYFSLQPGQHVYLVVSMGGGKDKTDHISEAQDMLIGLDEKKLVKMNVNHNKWWAEYWHLSQLDIGDEMIHKYYYGSLYALGCQCRPGCVATGIDGIFNFSDFMAFGGGFTLNYNFAAPFYGVFTSNRPFLAGAFCETMLDAIPMGKKYARYFLESWSTNMGGMGSPRRGTLQRGVYFPVRLAPWGYDAYNNFLEQKTNSLSMMMPFVWTYYYTHDKDFFIRKALPYCIEVANFWEDFLVKDESGRYNVYDSAAHETQYADDINPALALGGIRRLMKFMIEACTEFEVYQERIVLWKDILENLAPFPVVTSQKTNKPIFALAENNHGDQVSHTNLEGPVFPDGNVGLSSEPELVQRALNTIEIHDNWLQENNTPNIFNCAPRVGYPVEKYFEHFHTLINEYMRDNYILKSNRHGIESAGAIEGIHSLLLQSHEGFINLFPVWFKDRDASFETLRAYGAFLVSSEFKDGSVSYVDIVSEAGLECKVKNPWNSNVSVTDAEGNKVEYKSENGMIMFNTEINGEYKMVKA